MPHTWDGVKRGLAKRPAASHRGSFEVFWSCSANLPTLRISQGLSHAVALFSRLFCGLSSFPRTVARLTVPFVFVGTSSPKTRTSVDHLHKFDLQFIVIVDFLSIKESLCIYQARI